MKLQPAHSASGHLFLSQAASLLKQRREAHHLNIYHTQRSCTGEDIVVGALSHVEDPRLGGDPLQHLGRLVPRRLALIAQLLAL